MDAVEQLLATKEIETLITRCCQLCDDEDWTTFATLWTDDAEFGVEDGPTFAGKETMLEFVTTCLTPGYVGKHICSGTNAVGVSKRRRKSQRPSCFTNVSL